MGNRSVFVVEMIVGVISVMLVLFFLGVLVFHGILALGEPFDAHLLSWTRFVGGSIESFVLSIIPAIYGGFMLLAGGNEFVAVILMCIVALGLVLSFPFLFGFLAEVWDRSHGRERGHHGGGYDSTGSTGSSEAHRMEGRKHPSPLFQAQKIEKAFLSDRKTLRDSSGMKVGTLENAPFSDDQIIRDGEGRRVGRIEPERAL